MFCLHGFRRSIISDCDPRLTSEWWNLLCSKLGVLHMDSTAYQPQTNGRAERINQTMKQLLCGAHFNGDNWYDALPLAKMANNNAPLLNSTYTAYYLNYGFHPCCEADVFNVGHPANGQLEPTDDFILRKHSN